MRDRTIGAFVAAALAATVLAGCVIPEPGRGGRYYREGYDDRYRYDQRQDDRHGYDYDYRPPREYSDRDWDKKNYKLPTLVCASKNGKPNRCRTNVAIRRADLDKRYSGSPCTYGRTWGYDANEVWVTDGCRARFVLTPAGRWR